MGDEKKENFMINLRDIDPQLTLNDTKGLILNNPPTKFELSQLRNCYTYIKNAIESDEPDQNIIKILNQQCDGIKTGNNSCYLYSSDDSNSSTKIDLKFSLNQQGISSVLLKGYKFYLNREKLLNRFKNEENQIKLLRYYRISLINHISENHNDKIDTFVISDRLRFDNKQKNIQYFVGNSKNANNEIKFEEPSYCRNHYEEFTTWLIRGLWLIIWAFIYRFYPKNNYVFSFGFLHFICICTCSYLQSRNIIITICCCIKEILFLLGIFIGDPPFVYKKQETY